MDHLELWGYFHVGVPVFSMDLWGISQPVEDTVQIRSEATKKNDDWNLQTDQNGKTDCLACIFRQLVG